MLAPPVIETRAAILGGTVSVLAARPAVSELERRGIDVGPLLARSRLSRELLADGEARLPHRSVADLWEAAARAAGDRSFGLHVAERLPEGTFDVCDYLLSTAGTVREGLLAVTRYARLVHDDAEWQLTGRRLVRRVPMPAPQLDELVLAWLLFRSRQASAAGWSPERIVLQHALPDDGELERAFGCRVAFGGGETEIRLPPAALETPQQRGDTRLFAILARTADAQLASLSPRGDVVASVSATIARQLASAVPDLPATAAAVRVSERTLQRRLAEKGVTHSALVDEIRRGLARQYVAETRLTIDEIAERLRFADATAFHRAFKRWTGTPPAHHRRREQALGAPGSFTDGRQT